MLPGLIALAASLAVCLALPALYSSLHSCAQKLGQSQQVAVEHELTEAFLFIDSRRYRWALASCVVIAALGVALYTGNGLLGSLAGASSLLLPAIGVRWFRRRRRQRLLHQMPDMLDLLAASLRSGLSLLPAMQHLAQHQPNPLAQELSLVLRRHRLGASLEEALEDLRGRVGGSELALFVTAVTVARQLGGNLSEMLARLSQMLRDKQAIEDKITALTAQGRLQARIVGLLPLALLAVMTRMEPRAMQLMYTTPQGWAILLVIAALEISGALLLRRLVRIDV